MQRLFQISKELNIHYTDIISFLDGKGIKVSSHMATIDEDVYQIILNKFYNKKTHSRPKRKKKIIKKLVSREDGLGSNKKVKRNEKKFKSNSKHPPRKDEAYSSTFDDYRPIRDLREDHIFIDGEWIHEDQLGGTNS